MVLGSTKNPRFLSWLKRSRGDGDLVFVSGQKVVVEALSDEGLDVLELLVAAESEDSEELQSVRDVARMSPTMVEGRLLGRLAATKSAPKVGLLIRRPPAPEVGRWLDGAASGEVILALDGVQDPGNVGALIRVGEAAGVAGVVCASGTARAWSPRALRASAGSTLRVPVMEKVDGFATPGWVRISLDAEADEVLTPAAGPVFLAAGSEGRGLSGRFEGCRPMRLPMAGAGRSLGVLSAVSVALWVLTGFGSGSSVAPE